MFNKIASIISRYVCLVLLFWVQHMHGALPVSVKVRIVFNLFECLKNAKLERCQK